MCQFHVYQYVSISCLHNNQKLGKFCAFYKYYYFSLCKHWPTSGGCSNLKLTHVPINNQDPTINAKMFVLKGQLENYMYENYNLTVRFVK